MEKIWFEENDFDMLTSIHYDDGKDKIEWMVGREDGDKFIGIRHNDKFIPSGEWTIFENNRKRIIFHDNRELEYKTKKYRITWYIDDNEKLKNVDMFHHIKRNVGGHELYFSITDYIHFRSEGINITTQSKRIVFDDDFNTITYYNKDKCIIWWRDKNYVFDAVCEKTNKIINFFGNSLFFLKLYSVSFHYDMESWNDV